jgi:hypothetical protein
MQQQGILRSLRWALIAFCAAFATAVQADATFQSLRGQVRDGANPVGQSQRVFSGATITTGAGAQAVLRFDDGQTVVLHENTTFRITDFRFRKEEPRSDRGVFDLLRGALRVVSGAVASRSQSAFQLRVPQSTIGIRGTDFMVAIVNPAIIAVNAGAVAATNAGGTAVFGAGTFGSVASATSLAVAIPASAVPAAASAAFSSMNAVVGVVSGGMAPGAAGVGAGAAGAGIVPTAAVIGGLVAVGAAVSGEDAPTTTHHAK